MFLDEHGEILTPMLAWYDRRGEEYPATLSEADSAALYDICGLPLHSNYSAFKMRWLLEHYPLRNRRGLRWLHAPEVLLWRLTGEQRTDITLASRTLCLDVRKGEWSAKAAALLHVPVQHLRHWCSQANTPDGSASRSAKRLGSRNRSA